MQKKYAQRGQELGNSGEATNVPTQRLAENLLLLLPPLLKDLLFSGQFSNRSARRKELNATFFILISCQIASVSHQFQKAKEDLK